MQRNRWIMMGLLACLILGAGAYFLANSLMENLLANRSQLGSAAPAQPLNLPRLVLALLLGLIPVGILIWKRGRVVGWLLVSAILYVLLFNLRYLVVDRHPYTFEWITSASSLIQYVVVTSVVAMLLAWLVMATRLKIFGLTRIQAAGRSLALALTVIYLLSISVLVHFSVNGLSDLATLPGFNAIYLPMLALIDLLQVVPVILTSLVLAGISALMAIGDRRKKRSLLD